MGRYITLTLHQILPWWPNKINMSGECSTPGKMVNTERISVETHQERILFQWLWFWQCYIKNLKGRGHESVDRIHVSQDRVQWWAFVAC
jgi:hypothetical protein